MPTFTPETQLGQVVQELLLHDVDGLTLIELRRKLRREKGLPVSEDNLRELLQHRLFVALSDGRYILAGSSHPKDLQASKEEKADEILDDPWTQSLLLNLPKARHSYVIFDLETTGVHPGEDQIIQIAALKVLDNRPVAIRNWYVNPGDIDIPYSLQIILGMADNPTIVHAIKSAPPIDEILSYFLEFIEDLPLVAHNARFDGRFIHAALAHKPLSNPIIDNLELATLMLPKLHNHRLATVAEAISLPVNQLQVEWATLKLDSNFTDHLISSATLHNAITDVYVLFRVYQRLLEKLDFNHCHLKNKNKYLEKPGELLWS